MTHHRVIWDGKRMVPTRYYLTLGVRAKGTDHFLLGPIDVRVPKRIWDLLGGPPRC